MTPLVLPAISIYMGNNAEKLTGHDSCRLLQVNITAEPLKNNSFHSLTAPEEKVTSSELRGFFVKCHDKRISPDKKTIGKP
ncbi:MAG: hypothetical protein HGA62_03035 [Chlorobiaceae bacterium]|nr:hypothetical protein [Chlorobiaceae bacterium]NTV61808.1 hypothetical protein [Chlorobiaceae bacterium]